MGTHSHPWPQVALGRKERPFRGWGASWAALRTGGKPFGHVCRALGSREEQGEAWPAPTARLRSGAGKERGGHCGQEAVGRGLL